MDRKESTLNVGRLIKMNPPLEYDQWFRPNALSYEMPEDELSCMTLDGRDWIGGKRRGWYRRWIGELIGEIS